MKIGYNSLIQNVILKELINIMGTMITDLYYINDYYICSRKQLSTLSCYF